MSEETTETTGENPVENETPNAESTNDTERTFSQEDVDRIVSERIKREREKFSDYNTLKQQVEEFNATLERAKTEAVKEAQAEFAKEKAVSAIALEAKGRFADTEDALLNLRERVNDFITEEGTVNTEAVTAAVDNLLENKPHLGVSKSNTPALNDVGLGHSGGSKPPASNAQRFADFFAQSLGQN